MATPLSWRKEAGIRKRKEEEEVKGRKCRTTWLQGREAEGSRKREEGRGGGSGGKEMEDYLATGERRKEAGSRKREERKK